MKSTLLAAALLPLAMAACTKPACSTSTITVQPPCLSVPPHSKHCKACTVTSEKKAPCFHTDPCNTKSTATVTTQAACPTYNACGQECSTVVLVDTPIPCTSGPACGA